MKYQLITLAESAARYLVEVKKNNQSVTLQTVNEKLLSLHEEEPRHAKTFEVQYSLDGAIVPKCPSPVVLRLECINSNMAISYEFSKDAKVDDFLTFLKQQSVLSEISWDTKLIRGDTPILRFDFNSAQGDIFSRFTNALEKLVKLNLAPPGLTVDKLVELYKQDLQVFRQSVKGQAAAAVPASVSAKDKVAVLRGGASNPGDSKENSFKP